MVNNRIILQWGSASLNMKSVTSVDVTAYFPIVFTKRYGFAVSTNYTGGNWTRITHIRGDYAANYATIHFVASSAPDAAVTCSYHYIAIGIK